MESSGTTMGTMTGRGAETLERMTAPRGGARLFISSLGRPSWGDRKGGGTRALTPSSPAFRKKGEFRFRGAFLKAHRA